MPAAPRPRSRPLRPVDPAPPAPKRAAGEGSPAPNRKAGEGSPAYRPEPPRGRPVWLAALGGFVLGAGTVLLVVWVYGQQGGFVTPAARLGAPAQGTGYYPPGPPGPLAPPGPGVGSPPAPRAWPGSGLPSAAAPAWNPPAPAGTASPGTGPFAPAAPGANPLVSAGTAADIELLRGRNLLLPVQGVRPQDLKDSFNDARGGGGRIHDAMDIMAPRNTPVLAVEDGRVAKLFQSRQGGNTIYQFDPSGTYCYYYAHLDRYADDLREGADLHRGQLLGFVGSTGNADSASPHLHFAISRLTPDRRWWQGTPLNPYLLFHPR